MDAFWIHGSRAVGRNTSNSDIDYTFLVKNISDIKKLKKSLEDLTEWKEMPGFYPEQKWFTVSWKNRKGGFHDIGLHIITTGEFLKNFKNAFSMKKANGDERWLEPYMDNRFLRLQGEIQFLVVESFSIYDPHDYLKNTKKRLLKYPKKFSEKIVNDFTNKLKIRLMWQGEPWIPRNKFNFICDIKEILYYIAIAHYAKNRKFMQSGLKRYHHDLNEMKPDIRMELDRLLAIDNKFGKEDKGIYLKRIIKKLER